MTLPKLTLDDVIVINDKDQQLLKYLIKVRGEAAVVWAINNLEGKRKPYLSNIAKKLMVDVTDDDLRHHVPVSREKAKALLASLKKRG